MSDPALQRHLSDSRQIPSRKVVVNDPAQLPNDYSTTPGGTCFATTPGGTRIIYERKFLLQMRNSPLARTPPTNLPTIPGVTTAAEGEAQPKTNGRTEPAGTTNADKVVDAEEPQFEMDI